MTLIDVRLFKVVFHFLFKIPRPILNTCARKQRKKSCQHRWTWRVCPCRGWWPQCTIGCAGCWLVNYGLFYMRFSSRNLGMTSQTLEGFFSTVSKHIFASRIFQTIFFSLRPSKMQVAASTPFRPCGPNLRPPLHPSHCPCNAGDSSCIHS